ATNSDATPFQLEESANAPWTRMIVGFLARKATSLAWTESAMEAKARMPNSINRLISVLMGAVPIECGWGLRRWLMASASGLATWLHDMDCRTVLVDLAAYARCFTTHSNHTSATYPLRTRHASSCCIPAGTVCVDASRGRASMAALQEGHPAINAQVDPGHKAAGLGSQEQCRAPEFVRASKPTERNGFDHAFLELRAVFRAHAELLQDGGVGGPRTQHVGPDTPCLELDGPGLREGADRCL